MTSAAMRDAGAFRGASLEVHPETGIVLAADPALETLLGLEPGELVGRHITDLKSPAPPESQSDPFVDLFSDATHDLLGPLNQAGALSTLLVRKLSTTGLDSDTESLAGFISQSVKRMEALAGSLRLYTRILGPGTVLRNTDLNALTPAVLANFERATASGELEVDFGQLPMAACDVGQVLFLFTHLLENAWKFRRNGKASVQITVSRREGRHLFSVRDNGIGFDPRFSEQIFRMFKRLEGDRFPGTGTGLTICRQIIRRHNGAIWAEAAPAAGATFWFTLPLGG